MGLPCIRQVQSYYLLYMPRVQIITAMTIDGFLPEADNQFMQWVKTNTKGFPYWHERSVYRLMPHYPLLDLLAEQHSDKNKSETYIAEISDQGSIELMQGLSRYRLIDELVIYILPVVVGQGTSIFNNLTPSYWKVHQSVTFPNGICRIVYRRDTFVA